MLGFGLKMVVLINDIHKHENTDMAYIFCKGSLRFMKKCPLKKIKNAVLP